MTQQPKCKPLKCKTFAKIATRPTRGIRKGETLPPPTFEQVTTVDKFVAMCPYHTKDNKCTNPNEDFAKVTY
ncbi:MAG: hypothetical protein WC365_09110 [Candidatus Babeliales bacterium]